MIPLGSGMTVISRKGACGFARLVSAKMRHRIFAAPALQASACTLWIPSRLLAP